MLPEAKASADSKDATTSKAKELTYKAKEGKTLTT